MQDRFIKILNLLKDNNGFISSSALAQRLGVSSRTIRDCIKKNLTDLQKNGATIISERSKGIKLEINDLIMFNNYIEYFKKEQFNILDDQTIFNYILFRLLVAKDYIRIRDLSYDYHVSETVITRHLNSIKEIIVKYELDMSVKQYYGVKINGSEHDKRVCAVSNVVNIRSLININDISEIEKEIVKKLTEIDYNISEQALDQFISFLVLSLYMKNEYNNELKIDDSKIDLSTEYKLLDEINHFLIINARETLSSFETRDLSIFLYAHRIISIDEIHVDVAEEIRDTVERMLNKINESLNINLLRDIALTQNMISHIYSLNLRIMNKIFLKNELLSKVKIKYPFAYECAIIACSIIQEKYTIQIPEEEVGYIAMLLNPSISVEEKTRKKSNVILVCYSGRGASLLLKQSLIDHFGDMIENILIANISEIKELDYMFWDYILTTVTLDFPTKVPSIKIDNFIDDGEIKRIRMLLTGRESSEELFRKYIKEELFFAGVSFDNKEQAIDYMIEKINERISLPPLFKEYVYKREEYGNTAYNNMFSIPHPFLPITEETFVGIMILSKPLIWDKQKISLVALISSGRGESSNNKIYKKLFSVLTNLEHFNNITRNKSYEEFIRIISKV